MTSHGPIPGVIVDDMAGFRVRLPRLGFAVPLRRSEGAQTAGPIDRPAASAVRRPLAHFNVLNGGVHAPNALDFREFMVAPVGAPAMAEAGRAGAEVYAALRRELRSPGHPGAAGDQAA